MDIDSLTTSADHQDEAKPWTRDQALSLFKMYEDMGWGAKQQTISIVTWLTPIIFALIAFSVKSYCDPPSASATTSPATTSLASLTALALSTFMLAIVWGALKRAENNYTKSERVIGDANTNGLLPSSIYEIISNGRTEESGPDEQDKRNSDEQQKREAESGLRRYWRLVGWQLGLHRLNWVYILFPYLIFFVLVVGSFVLWWWPQGSAGMFCERTGLQDASEV